MMRFFTQQHRFYCGIDLHAKTMYVCILDQAGGKLVHQNIPTDAKTFLKLIAPYRDGIVVAALCMFSWYWLADLCAEESIPFVLGHALCSKRRYTTFPNMTPNQVRPVRGSWKVELRQTRDERDQGCCKKRNVWDLSPRSTQAPLFPTSSV